MPRPGTTLNSIASAARARSVSRQIVRDGGDVVLQQPIAVNSSMNYTDEDGIVYRLFQPGLDDPDDPLTAPYLWVK